MINALECSHRDTCLNILGCVYTNEGRFDRPVECFRKSLEIEPIANAAKWHMRDVDTIKIMTNFIRNDYCQALNTHLLL